MATTNAPTTVAPPARVFLSAEWNWLAVLNYEIEPELLAPYVPKGVELDFDQQGKTYVSLVGFLFQNTRVLGWSLPGYRDFEELNLRFYVVRKGAGEPRRGVVFIKEIVPRLAVSTIARAWYNENYHTLPMRHRVPPANLAAQTAPEVLYEFYLRGAWNKIRVKGHPESHLLEFGSHEAFILEHYWGYCRQRDGGTIEYRVEHPSWTVWPGAEAELDCDFAHLYGEPFTGVLSRRADSVFIARGSAVTVAKPVRIA